MMKQVLKYLLLLVIPILVINQQSIANVIITKNQSPTHFISHSSNEGIYFSATADNLQQEIFLATEYDNENEDHIDVDFICHTVYQLVNRLFVSNSKVSKPFFSPQHEVIPPVQKYILYCSLKIDC